MPVGSISAVEQPWSIGYREAIAVLRGWIGSDISLVMSVTREVPGELGPSTILSPRVYHGELQLSDLGPQTEAVVSFGLPTDPPEVGRINAGGVALSLHAELFGGAQWAAGCEGTVLRLRQGELEYEFILRAKQEPPTRS